MGAKAMLIDVTACEGCGACVEACKEANGLPPIVGEDPPRELDADTYCVIQERAERNVRRMCMHCENPSCASVCPVGALVKTPDGPVVWDETKCIGCRYCMVACPFSIPRYEWDSREPKIRKCVFCAGRLAKGEVPACADACPVEATKFGDRAELLAEAHERIAAEPDKYVHQVFGEHEIGGTSMLFLSDVPFPKLGFPPNLRREALPQLTHAVLSKIPGIVVVGGGFLWGMHWLTKRKNEIRAAEAIARGGEGDDR